MPATITDPTSVAAAVHGADAVVNLVGVLYSRGGSRSFEALHVEGAANVAKACAAAGVQRLIHMSALGADETSPSTYAQSKAAGEVAVKAAFPSVTIFRPSVVFGTEDGFLNLFGWIAQVSPVLPFFTNANPLTKAGGGPKFQPVYVGDVVEAMSQALTANGHAGKTYELVGPHVYDMREIMRIVNTHTQRKRWVIGLPFIVGQIASVFLQILPSPLLTPDQMRQLKLGSVGTGRKPGLAVFGISPTTLEVIAPTYLKRYSPLQQTKKLRLQAR